MERGGGAEPHALSYLGTAASLIQSWRERLLKRKGEKRLQNKVAVEKRWRVKIHERRSSCKFLVGGWRKKVYRFP